MSGTLRDECILTLRVPTEPSVWLRLWEIDLSDESDETRVAVIPAEVTTDYVAAIWDGDVVIENSSGSADGCANNDRIAAVTGGSILQLKSGTSGRVALVGLDIELRDIRYPRRYGVEFSAEGISDGSVKFFLRALEFDDQDVALQLEAWDRNGYLLTTVDGPRMSTTPPAPRDCTANELDFDLLPAERISQVVRGQPCAPNAWILDAWVPGDAMNPRALVGDPDFQNGCKIRCWGGGPIG